MFLVSARTCMRLFLSSHLARPFGSTESLLFRPDLGDHQGRGAKRRGREQQSHEQRSLREHGEHRTISMLLIRTRWISVAIILLSAISENSCFAETMPSSLQIINGNIFHNELQLTNSGDARSPTLSHDGTKVAYVREVAPDTAGWHSQIWLLDIKSMRSSILVDRPSKQPNISCRDAGGGNGFYNVIFWADDSLIIFDCTNWTTSAAVNIVNIQTKIVTFFKSGNGFWVINSGNYRNSILVRQHKYVLNQGSTDFFYIYDIRGILIGIAGETTEKTCEFLTSHATTVPNGFDCERDGRDEAEWRSRQAAPVAPSASPSAQAEPAPNPSSAIKRIERFGAD